MMGAEARRRSEPRCLWAALPLVLSTLGAGGCGLSVTNERPPYEELDAVEKNAVAIILQELQAFDLNVRLATSNKVSIDQVLDRERINVAFEGLIFVSNLGDNVIHISVWENLSTSQQNLVQRWFAAPSAAYAAQWYKKLFYRFLATVQGAKQYMFNVLTPEWVFGHRSVFNIERDSIRTALSHYVEAGRKGEMWGFLAQICAPVLSQYRSHYPGTWPDTKKAKQYMNEHVAQMTNPEDPTAYMYFICEWIELGKKDGVGFSDELRWLDELPL